MHRRTLILSAIAAGTLTLAGCGKQKPQTAGKYKPIVLGTLAGPHAEIAEVAAKVAAERGLQVKIVEFSDYGHVNEALNTRDVDCNAFQHKPYLDKAIASKGYKFAALGKTVLFPLGVYSQKIHSKDEIQDGMLVTLPADPANLGRALVLLETHGIITIKPGKGIHATSHDIDKNPHNLVFKEVDSAYLGRSLPDVGFAVINGSWAVKSNLSPVKDAFILEDSRSEFANILAVRDEARDRPEFKILLESYQSQKVRDFVKDKYKGSIVVAF